MRRATWALHNAGHSARSPSHGPCGAVLGLLSPRAVAGGWTGGGLTWPGATFCVVPRVGMCSLLVMQVGLGDCNGEGTRWRQEHGLEVGRAQARQLCMHNPRCNNRPTHARTFCCLSSGGGAGCSLNAWTRSLRAGCRSGVGGQCE